MRTKFAIIPLVAVFLFACVLTTPPGGQETATPANMRPNATKTPTIVPVVTAGYSMPFCVIADQTVYLRPAPNDQDYPLGVLARGEKVYPNGPVDGVWLRVSSSLGDGWVNGNYVGTCVSKSKNLRDRSENILE